MWLEAAQGTRRDLNMGQHCIPKESWPIRFPTLETEPKSSAILHSLLGQGMGQGTTFNVTSA
jgi:hypothetical protein